MGVIHEKLITKMIVSLAIDLRLNDVWFIYDPFTCVQCFHLQFPSCLAIG